MKLYKTSLMIIIMIGILFIGTSNPAKNIYKSSASIIGAISNKEPSGEHKEKLLICIDPGHQSKGDGNGEPIGPGAPYQKARVSSGTVGISTKKTRICIKFRSIFRIKAYINK